MATTMLVAGPLSAEFPATSFPQLSLSNRRPVLWFDAAVDEACQWTAKAPQGYTGAITLILSCVAASATSGAVGFQAALEAITAADAVDTDAADSFDTVNNSASTTVGSTAGYIFEVSITLTNADSIAAGDYYRIKVNRDGDGSAITDSATGDVGILEIELRY